MARVVAFTVDGRPRSWKRTAGTVIIKGKPRRLNDPDAEANRKVIAQLARIAWRGPPVCGPVVLQVRAIFAIPTGWPPALQQEARDCNVPHVQDPDLDRIYNLVADALVGIVYWDDNQICGMAQSAKRYGSPERTEITLEVLDQSEAQKTPGQRKLEAAAATGQMIAGKARPSAARNRSKTGSR
jgi:Holliday junction resolvase RusA-like endonuclease